MEIKNEIPIADLICLTSEHFTDYALRIPHPELRGSVTYVDGRKHGECLIYYRDQLYIKCNYVVDKLDGAYIVYWGNVTEHYMFSNGIREGQFTSYYDNGVLNATCMYVGGRKHGEFRNHRRDGTLFSTIIYNNGLPDVACIFYPDGEMREKSIYRDNCTKIDITDYRENGRTYTIDNGPSQY